MTTNKPNFIIVNSSEITKEMVNKYLDNDYHKWIANVLTDICNDPHCIHALRKQIKEDWDLRNMLKRYDKILMPKTNERNT